MKALESQSVLDEIQAILRSQAKTLTPFQRSQHVAIINWLKRYQVPSGSTNLEQVRGSLEAFYHLCKLENYSLAFSVVISPVRFTDYLLHEQLGIWGYSSERLVLGGRSSYPLQKRFQVACSRGVL